MKNPFNNLKLVAPSFKTFLLISIGFILQAVLYSFIDKDPAFPLLAAMINLCAAGIVHNFENMAKVLIFKHSFISADKTAISSYTPCVGSKWKKEKSNSEAIGTKQTIEQNTNQQNTTEKDFRKNAKKRIWMRYAADTIESIPDKICVLNDGDSIQVIDMSDCICIKKPNWIKFSEKLPQLDKAIIVPDSKFKFGECLFLQIVRKRVVLDQGYTQCDVPMDTYYTYAEDFNIQDLLPKPE